MFIRILYIVLLLFLASCANYNNIRFVNSGEYKAVEKISPNENEEIHVKQDDPPCDTLKLKDGSKKLGKVVGINDGFVELKKCEDPRSSDALIQYETIDQIMYSAERVSKEYKNTNHIDRENKKDPSKRINGLLAGFIVNFSIAFICGILTIIAFQPFLSFFPNMWVYILIIGAGFLVIGTVLLAIYLVIR